MSLLKKTRLKLNTPGLENDPQKATYHVCHEKRFAILIFKASFFQVFAREFKHLAGEFDRRVPWSVSRETARLEICMKCML